MPSTTLPVRSRYGFEAEFFGIGQSRAAELIKSRTGLDAENDGYHHEVRDYWRVTSDTSVTGEGCELVSPILTRSRGFVNTKKVIDTLRNEGAVIDASCGLHVHHDATGASVDDILQSVGHYAIFEPVIDAMLPRSRRLHSSDRGSAFNGSLARTDSALESLKSVIKQHDSLQALANESDRTFMRHLTVNLTSLYAHGTLEFRQHSGTLNPNKVNRWVEFTRLFMDANRRGLDVDVLSNAYRYTPITDEWNVERMIRYLGGGDELVAFYLARVAKLNGTDPVADDDDTAAANERHDDSEFDEHDTTCFEHGRNGCYDCGWCDDCYEYDSCCQDDGGSW